MNRNDDRVFAYLLLTIAVLSVIALLCAAALGIAVLATGGNGDTDGTDVPQAEDTTSPTADTWTPPAEVTLQESADAGMEYIDKMIFFGESTTSHLRSRGVLSGGRDTHQVWEDRSSGTKTLSSKLLSEPIDYPPTGERLTVAQAVEKEQPAYVVLSFGLNNITAFINNKSSYINNYNKLINAIQTACPDTRIILQTVYPVTAACNAWAESGAEISAHTRTLNGWLLEIAAAHQNVRVVDTASVLTNAGGCLNGVYDVSGDGIHLTTAAYEEILYYLRTHAWEEPQKGN